jgi:hypothetical protein
VFNPNGHSLVSLFIRAKKLLGWRVSSKRYDGLIEELAKNKPEDYWIARWRSFDQTDLLVSRTVDVYRRAVNRLDSLSWDILRKKLVGKFNEPENPRGKLDFFSTMNEAFGYEFLVRCGAKKVRLIEEDREKRTKTPDLVFESAGNRFFCEVKTIAISEPEVTRRVGPPDSYDASVYSSLGSSVLGKIRKRILEAEDQASELPEGCLVFVVIDPDDFTQAYLSNYKSELENEVGKSLPESAFCVSVGIFGGVLYHQNLHKYFPRSSRDRSNLGDHGLSSSRV